jgi:glycosyltransferase involved in cell wall biosynthesis
MNEPSAQVRVAVLIPCHNEGNAIASVVRDLRKALPAAAIYVYDNNSSDDTIARAQAAGAIVRSETAQGKGHVVRRMFADVDADIYLMLDGDGTYDAASAPRLIQHLRDQHLDMVVGARLSSAGNELFRRGHRWGNRLINWVVDRLFDSPFTDILSGYRAMTRRFVKSFPALASGFEIETMLTVHALELRLPVAEVECPYRERAQGTHSKLQTYRDGWRILFTIFQLLKTIRPFFFFGVISFIFVAAALLSGIPVVIEYLETGLVPRFPTAILATGLMVLAGISLTAGLILDSVSRGVRDIKRLHYLALGSPSGQDRDPASVN